jgi:dTDP-4-dehydrorhamnose reductase
MLKLLSSGWRTLPGHGSRWPINHCNKIRWTVIAVQKNLSGKRRLGEFECSDAGSNLGGAGMLGHKLWQSFTPRFDTHVTFRKSSEPYEARGLYDMPRALGGVTPEDFESIESALDTVQPKVVVNCIGIVKQDPGARDPVASITVNALFPHRLARACRNAGVRLIHLSTDCVFSGRKGNYAEIDSPDADDLYGRTAASGKHTAQVGTLKTSETHGVLWFARISSRKMSMTM